MLEPNALRSSLWRDEDWKKWVCLPLQLRAQRKLNWEYLPPSSIAEPAGIHLAHVTHTNDTDDKVIHLALKIVFEWGSHCTWYKTSRSRGWNSMNVCIESSKSIPMISILHNIEWREKFKTLMMLLWVWKRLRERNFMQFFEPQSRVGDKKPTFLDWY